MSNKRGFLNVEKNTEQEANRQNHLLGIAINDYEYCPKLSNAVKDVEDFIALMRKDYSFEDKNIYTLFDTEATRPNIRKTLRDLVQQLTPSDNLIVYFSGHGQLDEVIDEAYWIPIEGKQKDDANYISNSEIKGFLASMKAHHIFLIVDSCFSGALLATGTKNIADRLEQNPSRWALTSGKKEVVSDGKAGENSPFATSLLYHLAQATKPISVQELFFHVQETTAANAAQTPLCEPLQLKGHYNGQFVFYPKNVEIPQLPKDSDPFERLMMPIPTGVFEMGNPDDDYEQSLRTVTISGFYMSKYPTTQKQWVSVMGNNPSYFQGGDDCPVENVSYDDVQEFLKRLNHKTGKNYRLPSEAEWEYAARANQNHRYAGSDAIEKVAWYCENSSDQTQSVGQKQPNNFGLYDMSGNVLEWCEDRWHNHYGMTAPIDNFAWTNGSSPNRVLRGGSWADAAKNCTCFVRGYGSPDNRADFIGFRLVHW